MRFELSPTIHALHPWWKVSETGYATWVKRTASPGQAITVFLQDRFDP